MTQPYVVVSLEDDKPSVRSVEVESAQGNEVHTKDGRVFVLDAQGIGSTSDRSARLVPMDKEIEQDLVLHGEGYDPEAIEREFGFAEPSLDTEWDGEIDGGR